MSELENEMLHKLLHISATFNRLSMSEALAVVSSAVQNNHTAEQTAELLRS